jgi:hypothetical protein
LEWFGVESLNLSKRPGEVQPTSDLPMPTPEHLALSKEASPITYISPDDPPIYLFYNGANTKVTEETNWGVWIHHPILGIKLKEALDEKNMESYLEYKNGPKVEGYKSRYEFLIDKLKG